jgi:Glucose inhibited division protein A
MSFLIAHQVYPHFFNLGGRLAPISIRDQLVRAQAIIEDAVAEGLIGQVPFRPLLVVGAGAAGAAAAVWAAQLGVPTTLIERGPNACTLQAGCTTRWIDPGQYDWPVNHWVNPVFPCAPVPAAMPWPANLSNILAAGWQGQLHAGARRCPDGQRCGHSPRAGHPRTARLAAGHSVVAANDALPPSRLKLPEARPQPWCAWSRVPGECCATLSPTTDRRPDTHARDARGRAGAPASLPPRSLPPRAHRTGPACCRGRNPGPHRPPWRGP